jgi:NADPH:quinone reductase-like Zn-dependent oxidoreductase
MALNTRRCARVITFRPAMSAPWISLTTSRTVIAGPVSERVEDLQKLATLAEAGEFKAVIDRRYPLEAIQEAHRYVDSGRKRGSVVITVGSS